MTIKAVTFDLWDTMVDDDSDEPKRTAKGLRSKRDERRHLVWAALNAADPGAPIDLDSVVLAYDTADAGFNLVWKELHINWTVEQRLRVVLNGLGRSLPPDAFDRLVEDTGRMEVEIPPDPIDGIGAALADLSRRYKLAVVSDAIVTPGTGLKAILEGHGLAQYFSAFAFSDEVGHSKPHRSMFDCACDQLGVGVDEIVHIGDRDHNDVKGPHALGAKAILFTAARDADKDATTADAVCEHHRDLPATVDRLAAAN
jgi:putative hydrolase of the HAD superfamily